MFRRLTPRLSYPLSAALLAVPLMAIPVAAEQRPAENLTALDAYVHQPDPAFRFHKIDERKLPGCSIHVLHLVSQKWRDEPEVSPALWEHHLTLAIPDKVEHSTGLLMISGGDNDDPMPRPPREEFVQFALGTGSVIAELRMVPNQPTRFSDSERAHKEDSLIAFTWDKFLRTGDTLWLARLPMTKSAVRAMDAITAYCSEESAGNHTVDSFVVAGASKRGWTTWSTAAVDRRVVAAIPIVIDMLNVVPSFKHHYQAYGFFAPAVDDYVAAGIMNWQDRPEYQDLLRIEEPYEYRQRLTMPKFIVNATGDQFFLPDSSRFYFDDLPGQKHLRYVPNADHGLRGSDAIESIAAYYESILMKRELPTLSWKFEEDGSITVQTDDAPEEVRVWQAVNPDARDFRKDTIGATWTATPAEDRGSGLYRAAITEPSKGWAAFLLELTFPTGSYFPLKFTTGVRVLPDTLPHAPYQPDTAGLPPLRQ